MAQHRHHRLNFHTNGFSRVDLNPAEAKIFEAGIEVARQLHSIGVVERTALRLGTVLGMRGYIGYAALEPGQPSTAEKKRRYYSFEYGHEGVQQADELASFLRANNVWPGEGSVHKNLCIEIQDVMKEIAIDTLMKMHIKEENVLKSMFEMPTGNTRLIRYSGDGESNIPYHLDYEYITLIYTNRPSLIVKHNNILISANEDDKSLIVLPGDALARLSGGEFNAVLHGAAPNAERYSIVYFLCSGTDIWLNANGLVCDRTNTDAVFCPAEHLAGMHLANNEALRRICRSPYLNSLIPEGNRNPNMLDNAQ